MTEQPTWTSPVGARERVGFSPARVSIVALNTFTESVRQRVYNILLIFALIVIGSASFFSQFTFGTQLKFVKDFCLGALSVFGTLIAIVGTAQLIPNELENRTIYTILAKPVRRFEFLLGKYMGSVLLIFMSLVMMSVLFGAALMFKGNHLVRSAKEGIAAAETVVERDLAEQELQKVYDEMRDVDIVKGILLILVKLALLAAITLLFSTVSTSMVFNVTAGFMAFLAGQLRSGAAEMWGHNKWVMYLLAIIPDLGAFNVTDDIVIGNVIPWHHVAEVALYGVGRTLIILVAAHLIFSRREI